MRISDWSSDVCSSDLARDGNASIEGRPVQPGDIAVLVRSHNEATRIRHALAMAGIPAVAAGKQSLFATPEARDLHALLLALLHGADDGRLRMARSEEHTSELPSLMRISYPAFRLKKQKIISKNQV